MGTSVTTAVHTDYMGQPIGDPIVITTVTDDDIEVLDGAEVPKGSIDQVLAWVTREGYDPVERAKAALVAEHDRDHPKQPGKKADPRQSLIRKLNKLLSEG